MARSEKDATLIASLAAGHSLRAAAELAGVNEKTVTRKLKEPAFRREVHRHRAQMLERAAGRLADSVTSAVNTLCNLLESESQSIQLSASSRILDFSVRVNEAVELESRLRDIEEFIERQKKESKK